VRARGGPESSAAPPAAYWSVALDVDDLFADSIATATGAVIIGCPHSKRLLTLPKLKILEAVIRPVSVLMMNVFGRQKESPKSLLHHQPMLAHVACFGCPWMIWCEYPHVAARIHDSTTLVIARMTIVPTVLPTPPARS
jgi:hypothetical protein